MKQVLIAEDEASIREFVVINLQRAGYDVLEAENGEQAMELYEQNKDQIDIAVLDIMMPGMDGTEVCTAIRRSSGRVGIIMLTAKTQEADKITSLTMGADDYVTKPFSPSELVARVDALYRRVEFAQQKEPKAQSDTIAIGNFTLDTRKRTLTKEGKNIELTQVEYQIVEYFFDHPGKIVDRTDILAAVWGEAYFGEEKIVDVNIRRLRMKIEDQPSAPQYIITVWGQGYKWNIE